MTDVLRDKRLKFIDTAELFFIFARQWWDGCGIDCVAWHFTQMKFHRTVVITGETTEYIEPSLIRNDIIIHDEFDRVMKHFSQFNIRSLSSQNERIATCHYDNWIGIKDSDSS